MSNITDYIKVDLYGQYNNDTIHAYTYPEKITNQHQFFGTTEWLAPISDPRGVYQSVCRDGSCYMVFRHQRGYYYSYIERNINDSRGGLEMITIYVPSSFKASGISVLAALKELRTQLIGNRSMDDQLTKTALSRIKPTEASLFPQKVEQNPTGQPVVAYRTYKDEMELQDIFAFLKQNDYVNVDKLVVVKDGVVREGTSIQKISRELRKFYSIASLPDAIPDKKEVVPGESLRIVYKKNGFMDLVDSFEFNPNENSRFHVYGNDVSLLSPSERHLKFSKSIDIEVVSSDGRVINPKTVEASFDGRPVKRSEQNGRLYAYVNEDDIYEGSQAVLHVAAKNYEDKEVIVSLSNVENHQRERVQLSPKTRMIKMRFSFGDIEHEQYNTPVYDVPIPQTNPMLDDLFFQKSFYGYDVWKNSEDVFNVSLPYIERHRIDAHKHHKGLPKWLKILLFSLAGTIVALSLFIAGLFVGKGLSKKAAQSHQIVNEAVYSTPQQGQPVIDTLKVDEVTDTTKINNDQDFTGE